MNNLLNQFIVVCLCFLALHVTVFGQTNTTTAPTSVSPNSTTSNSSTTVQPPVTTANTSSTNSTMAPLIPSTPNATSNASTVSPKPGPTTKSTPTTLTTTPATAAPTVPSQGQHFDAASFIGGIVLCGGVIAIIFFGCKFYKARSEQNYHTL
ncbi:uncharacterized protein LOC141915485 isoform X1 [Tubulanus polymorphus]|uniref:uncharacterized protein LOC141915485 isoform X1 n=1 Tax=Tubulanus polymorphus TaxID=672921 RepID=UPI003DA54D18